MAGTRPETDTSSQEATRCTISLALRDEIREDTKLWTKPRPLSLHFVPLPNLFQLEEIPWTSVSNKMQSDAEASSILILFGT